MAMVDYGAIVIKNGRIINENEWFQDMKREVGWSDDPFRERYPECDFHDPYKCVAKQISNCHECPRAKYAEGVDDAIEDCKGISLEDVKSIIDGNYFAYIGDKELTIGFYKTMASFFINGVRKDFHAISDYSFEDPISRKSIHLNINGTKIDIKKIGDCQYSLSMRYKDDRYFVVYGYGIDSNIKVWNECKVKYLGKRKAKAISNIIASHTKLDCKQFLVDDETDLVYSFIIADHTTIRTKYGITNPIEEQCGSNKDFCDCLNMYFGFKKFEIKYADELRKETDRHYKVIG